MDIEDLRTKIDLIDDEIINLLDERFKVTDEIGKIKKNKNILIQDNKREEEILKKIQKKSKIEELSTIYKTIISCSKKRQK